MISNFILNHAKVSSSELIKQTSKNIEAILTGFTVSRDNTLAEYISVHDSIEDVNLKAQNERKKKENR